MMLEIALVLSAWVAAVPVPDLGTPERSSPPAPPEAQDPPERALIVVPPVDFRDEEYEETRKALEKNGLPFQVASSRKGKIKGMLGLVIEAGIDLENAEPQLEHVALVVFVGGSGTTRYFENEQVKELARRAVSQRKLIGAICLAPSILARAGVLQGRKATVWPSEAKTLTANGAVYVKEPIVIDGRFVTANGPEAAPAFASALIEFLHHRARSRRKCEELLEAPLELRADGKHEKAREQMMRVYKKHRENPYIGSKALFETAFSLYQERKYSKAVAAFDRVGVEYPRSDFFGMAMFNAAMISDQDLDKKRKAIELYRRLVRGDCNDWDKTGSLMDPYRNYRYKALLNTGGLFLELKEPAEALQAFLDSYHKGYFVSHCGTCTATATKRCSAKTAKAASALIGIPADETQRRCMVEAKRADAYLLGLGMEYRKGGHRQMAGKTFAALRKSFPKSKLLAKIPGG